MTMLPFRVEITTRAIEDLHRRMSAMRWPEIPFETGWSAGTDAATLRRFVRDWRFRFDWMALQARLNRLPHVRGVVGGDELHAVLLTGVGHGRMPLLMLHDAPGSFLDLLSVGGLLSEGGGGAPFDVVIPSLPGFGFSEPPQEAGMHPARMAERMHALMRTLGYPRYGVQGGGWGATIATRLAQQRPESVAALHLHSLLPPPGEGHETPHARLAGARPQALAFALNDSPIGLLAWTLDELWTASGGDEALWQSLDRDLVFETVTLCWLSGTALSAARLQYEAAREPAASHSSPVDVPTAFARFPSDREIPSRSAIEQSYRIERWTEMPRGGRFAALQEPRLLAGDITAAFRVLG